MENPEIDLKQTSKEALAETRLEQRDLVREVLADVLQDFAMAEAIREGTETKPVNLDEIFNILRSKP